MFFFQDISWKNGWNETSANKACNDYFHQQSELFSACSELSNVDANSSITNCILNIQVCFYYTMNIQLSMLRSQKGTLKKIAAIFKIIFQKKFLCHNKIFITSFNNGLEVQFFNSWAVVCERLDIDRRCTY